MKITRPLMVFIFILFISGCWSQDDADAPAATLTIFAAASTTDFVTELAQQFERETGIHARLNFASSSTLARQIESGAPADIFVSANEAWMDYLAERNLIDSTSRFDLLGNELVMIARRESQITVEMTPSFDVKSVINGRIAMGDPEHVPAGIYGRQASEALEWWDDVAASVVMAPDVRAALRLVLLEEADIGIVYRSDAIIEPNVTVIGTFPTHTHDRIVYPIAPTQNPSPAATQFIEFARGAADDALLAPFGFTAP